MLLQQRAVGLRPSARRPVVRCNAGAQVATLVRPEIKTREAAPQVELDVEALLTRLEARAKAMIALEEQELATRTKVKFVLPQKIGLGESWKIVGKCPELGSMKPEVAPYMQWTNGDVWTLEVPIRAGAFTYKAVLRKADGQYLWESGAGRVLEVPFGEPKAKEVKLDGVKFL